MANWISSKLKVAETLLQQIDQQAAESLGKNEKQLSYEITLDTPTKPNGGVSLKDQLKRKPQDNNDYQGKLFSDPISNMPSNNNDSKSYNSVNITSREKEISRTRASSKPNTKLTDSDWTELLSTPSQGTSSSTNGVFGIRSLKKDGGTKGHLGSHLSLLEEKWKQKRNVNGSKSVRRSDIVLGNKLNGKRSNGEESSASLRPSSVDKQNDGKNSEELELDHKDTPASFMVKMKDSRDEENDRKLDSKELLINLEGFSLSANKNQSTQKVLDLGEVDGVPDALIGIADAHGQFRTTVSGKSKSIGSSRSSVFDGVKGASQPSSDASSDLDPDSGSASDSESEHEREERRKRKERLMAERAAVKAVDAIKERENTVARLEGEKQSLEKILEEGAKQHAQEASELQTTTMEMMDAVELEKQKHNDTRMEALQRLAKLETTNADLARSLATAQKRLEVEINRVADLRRQIELEEAAHEELKRRIASNHQSGTNLNQLAASKGIEFGCEILEAEMKRSEDGKFVNLMVKLQRKSVHPPELRCTRCALPSKGFEVLLMFGAKAQCLDNTARQLEASIELTRKAVEDPTEVEVELKRRLGPLTDHLIQKQAQVEALSSEKATLSFRIEAVSRILEEGKSTNMNNATSSDLELGTWGLSSSKFNPVLKDKICSGKRQLGSMIKQLDAIFLAGQVSEPNLSPLLPTNGLSALSSSPGSSSS
ncbi:Golgin candidate 2 -like protein [Gossypium arboreum]|uniref:Golgin candidate 2-like protein n=1 Tax=Gossypium arboreum TaxID=29729 RepID=A0A0B0PRB4_GOSAR|nr:Golgin candidate 2 -like protein [Gossypium arboreum]